ncbi:nuclear transport factor 2 family protein [Chryseobacterium capnotolerans]|uniref:nuclear transport factor 2 family protein n=1 Tax=Chryseobacterium TaxID=59732 RepID=UPI0009EE6789|nr:MULTISPECIES: nuclear transport factor 2 family protein [Chryseobacterium]UHO38562.1 nuclear transport factor 2 family protein [Chryseobacterium capnotolerans]
MKKQNLIFVLTLFCFMNLYAQNNAQNNAQNSIRETIEMYFDGWKKGDTLKVGKAMHSTCKLKNLKEDKVIVFDRKTYLSGFKPKTTFEKIESKILSLDITGNIAAAKCEIKTAKYIFTDYFNLMYTEGRWYIVDKISTRKEI